MSAWFPSNLWRRWKGKIIATSDLQGLSSEFEGHYMPVVRITVSKKYAITYTHKGQNAIINNPGHLRIAIPDDMEDEAMEN